MLPSLACRSAQAGLGPLAMRAFLTSLALLMLPACSHGVSMPSISNSVAGDDSGLRRSDDPHFSAEEHRIVAAARAYLERSRQQPLDARYRVERTQDGYLVFAMFITGYQNGHPLYSPGGHGVVVLRADGSFVRYLPGE